MDDAVAAIERLTDAATGRPLAVAATNNAPDLRDNISRELDAARVNATVDQMPDPPGSMVAVKRSVLRLGGFNWVRQRAANHALARAIELLAQQVEATRVGVERSLRRHAGAIADLGVAVQDVARRDAPSVTDLSRESTGRRSASDEELATAEFGGLAMRLQDGFRPTTNELTARLSAYLPDLERAAATGRPLVDIGAGRGDLLALLRDHGIAAVGVDHDPIAVANARDRGLTMIEADYRSYLEGASPGSLGAVVALHVIEHLDARSQIDLVDLALSALAPGGLLVLETPNPHNVLVGSATFYLDPTHRRPVPPAYLDFLVRDRGFEDVEVRELHPVSTTSVVESLELDESLRSLLLEVERAFRGPLDYAVVARRPVT